MNAQALQLLISVGGIATMVGLCRALFGHKEASLSHIELAAESLERDIPGFRAGQTAVSGDWRSALLEDLQDGQIYLAIVRGEGLVTRKLTRGIRIARDADRLRLKLQDFTLRAVELDLPDAAAWEVKLKGLAA
jgi:hypothetical protein